MTWSGTSAPLGGSAHERTWKRPGKAVLGEKYVNMNCWQHKRWAWLSWIKRKRIQLREAVETPVMLRNEASRPAARGRGRSAQGATWGSCWSENCWADGFPDPSPPRASCLSAEATGELLPLRDGGFQTGQGHHVPAMSVVQANSSVPKAVLTNTLFRAIVFQSWCVKIVLNHISNRVGLGDRMARG